MIERQAGRAATLELSSEIPAAQFIAKILPRILERLDRYGAVDRSVLLAAPAQATFGSGTQPVAAYGVDPSLGHSAFFRIHTEISTGLEHIFIFLEILYLTGISE